MHEGKRVLALIPARGGSKGLPRKAVLDLEGRPLVVWTVEAARACRYVDDVVMTTEDAEIAEAARSAGAEVPFVRPAELACDEAPMTGVVLHALDALETEGRVYDVLVLLQPTSPLRTAADIDAAVERLNPPAVEAVVGVCGFEHSPLLAVALTSEGMVGEPLEAAAMTANRQQYPVYYRINGAVYVSTVDAYRRKGTFVHERTAAYVMPAERSVDIDHALDLDIAALLLRRRLSGAG